MRNKTIYFCLKLIAAMAAAFLLLNLFCVLYYNLPVHRKSETKATDHLWEGDRFYSKGTEGFAYGVTDKNGFNNVETFEEGEIDILVMGSSHMEGMNVAQNANTTALLNKMFDAEGIDLNAYNIGMSGHALARCLNNLNNAIEEFKPRKYVVIEAASLQPDVESLQKVSEGTLKPVASANEGIVEKLQRLPFLRLMYYQIKTFGGDNGEKDDTDDENEDVREDEDNQRNKLLDSILKKCEQVCENAGVELIILYNCEIEFDEQGTIVGQDKIDQIERFESICDKNNVIFVNMYDSFKENYYKTKKLPRGFSNTSAGKGHLNEEGHRVIAEKLFSVICG